ncbi:hypothetical protein HDU78_010765 [Chytriomyces hyalinus]|nr:hypothetical protein HDU78_010765 [Chytriomyces hyalinus]
MPKPKHVSPSTSTRPVSFSLSIGSGLLAATSTLLAKLTAQASDTVQFKLPFLGLVSVPNRSILVPLVVLSNIAMWAVFTRALSASSSSAAVTVLSNSANMIASALLGYVVFSESLSMRWWIGCAFVLAGSAIMNRGGDSVMPVPSPSKAQGHHKYDTRSKKRE